VAPSLYIPCWRALYATLFCMKTVHHQLTPEQSDIMKRDPRSYHAIRIERHENDQMKPGNRAVRGWLERSRIAHAVLKILAVFGVSLIMADGILTPAQSVLGAIQGIKVVRPDLGTSTIVGVSCAILVLLFLVQPLGISRLASSFAPVVVLWLLFNLVFGIYVSCHPLSTS